MQKHPNAHQREPKCFSEYTRHQREEKEGKEGRGSITCFSHLKEYLIE
jgi:hypothetical protein